MDLRHRLRIWRRELVRPWWGALTAILTLAANWDRFAGWFGYNDRYGLAKFIRRIDGETWFVLWLALTAVVLLNRVYHLAVDRDGLKAQLEKVRSNQELSDLLSDKHEYGVHEMLNKPPTSQAEFDAWLKNEAEFTQSVLQIMDPRSYAWGHPDDPPEPESGHRAPIEHARYPLGPDR